MTTRLAHAQDPPQLTSKPQRQSLARVARQQNTTTLRRTFAVSAVVKGTYLTLTPTLNSGQD